MDESKFGHLRVKHDDEMIAHVYNGNDIASAAMVSVLLSTSSKIYKT